jgi:hypothetical protein
MLFSLKNIRAKSLIPHRQFKEHHTNLKPKVSQPWQDHAPHVVRLGAVKLLAQMRGITLVSHATLWHTIFWTNPMKAGHFHRTKTRKNHQIVQSQPSPARRSKAGMTLFDPTSAAAKV